MSVLASIRFTDEVLLGRNFPLSGSTVTRPKPTRFTSESDSAMRLPFRTRCRYADHVLKII